MESQETMNIKSKIKNKYTVLFICLIGCFIILSNNVSAVESDAPNLTINSPTEINYSTSEISFNVTALDDTGVDSCWFSLDEGIINYTMINLTTTEWNYTNSSIPDGQYTVNFYCNDTLGNLNNTENISFGIDTDYPNLTILYPTNNLIKEGAYDIPLNFLATDDNLDTCWYNLKKLDGTTETSNTSTSCSANTTFDVSVYDIFILTFYTNDSTGNENSSLVVFTVNQPSSSAPPDGGTGGDSSYTQPTGLGDQNITENETEEYEMNKEICQITYYHLLTYGNESYNINLLIGRLEAQGLYETKLNLEYWYLDRFQETCSRHILRTEKPELLCNEIYWLITNKGWNFKDYDIFNITKNLESEIDINENIVREYLNNHQKLCVEDGLDGRQISERPIETNLRNGLLWGIGIILLLITIFIFANKPTVYKK